MKASDLGKQNRDLYTALNVDKNASNDDIRAAYLRLASSMHPDKHANSASRMDAEQQFVKIDKAYKVLMDPLLRHAYDLHGERGLRLLQSVPQHEMLPLRFPVEVAYILEELTSEEAQFAAMTSQTSSGTVTVQMEVPPLRPLRPPQLKQLTVDQQMEVSLTKDTTVFAGLYVVNRKQVGLGMGYVGTRVRLNKGTWVSGTYVLSQKRKLTIETARELSKTMNVRTSLSVLESGVMGLKLASSNRLNPTLMGSVDVAIGGNEDSLGVGITSSQGKAEVSGRIRVSASEIAVKGIYENRISHALQLKCVGKLGNRGLECLVSGTRNLTSITAINLGLSVALDGVTVNIKARRGRHNLYVPIKISARCDPWSILAGSMINAALNSSLLMLLRPFEKIRIQRQLRLIEKEMSEKQGRERRNAAAQVRLMVEAAKRKEEVERTVEGGGLVILEARYGKHGPVANSNGTPPDKEWYLTSRENDHTLDMASSLDVRIPLQFFVSKSKLYLPPGSKAGILGFYDVSSNPTWLLKTSITDQGQTLPPKQKAPEDRPCLYVRYSWRKQVYEITVDDYQLLELPPADERDSTKLGREGSVF